MAQLAELFNRGGRLPPVDLLLVRSIRGATDHTMKRIQELERSRWMSVAAKRTEVQ